MMKYSLHWNWLKLKELCLIYVLFNQKVCHLSVFKPCGSGTLENCGYISKPFNLTVSLKQGMHKRNGDIFHRNLLKLNVV